MPELYINSTRELVQFTSNSLAFIRQRLKKEYLVYSVIVRPEFETILQIILCNPNALYNNLIINDNTIQINPDTFNDSLLVALGFDQIKLQVFDN